MDYPDWAAHGFPAFHKPRDEINSGLLPPAAARLLRVYSNLQANDKSYQHNGDVYGNVYIQCAHMPDMLIESSFTQRKRRSQTRGASNIPDYKWKIRPGWTKWYWQLVACRTYAGWDFTISTYNYVHWSAPIWNCCETGDLAGLQQLIAAGKASFNDRMVDKFPGSLFADTPLLVAFENHRIDLLRYIIRITGITSDLYECPLAWDHFYTPVTPSDYSKIYTAMAFIVSHSDFDCDFIVEAAKRTGGKRLFYPRDAECVRLSHSGLSTPFETLPALDRTQISWHLAEEGAPLELVLESLGRNLSVESFVDLCDKRGNTIFHILPTRSISRDSTWYSFLTNVMRAGLSPHKRNGKGMTPLQCLVKFRDIRLPIFRVSAGDYVTQSLERLHFLISDWSKLLLDAGLDLMAYGRQEHLAWQQPFGTFNSFTQSVYSNTDQYQILDLHYGHIPSHWDFQIRLEESHVQWLPLTSLRMPGGWPSPQTRDLCLPWQPSEKDLAVLPRGLCVQSMWRARDHKVYSNMKSLSTVVEGRSWSEITFESKFGAQDDSGQLMIQLGKAEMGGQSKDASGPCLRPRSYSQPAVTFGGNGYLSDWRGDTNHRWTNFHRCIIDGQWKPGWDFVCHNPDRSRGPHCNALESSRRMVGFHGRSKRLPDYTDMSELSRAMKGKR